MRKRLVFVEANTTGTGVIALQKALAQGYEPLFLTNSPARYHGLDPESVQVITCDTNQVSTLRRVIESQMRPEECSGVMTTSEFYLETVAELSWTIGLPGNSPEAIRACRNKALTRRTLHAAGVLQPRYATITDTTQVRSALDHVGLPCVVKPADDTGSNAVRLCTNVVEAEAQIARILAVTVNVRGQMTVGAALIEEYLSAPEFSVEMFTWQGHTTCIGITEKHLTGIPYFVEAAHFFPAPLPAEQAREMEETVRRALSAVGITHGATHTEVKLTARGSAVVEINARLAGGMIPELIRLATGGDALDQQIRVAAGQTPDVAYPHRRHAGIQFLMADSEGILAGLEGTRMARSLPGVEQVTVTAEEGRQVRPAQNAYDRLGFVIASGETHAQTVERLQAAHRQIAVRVRSDVASVVGGGTDHD